MAETVEIRVHGVSGTPPESLLEIETVTQVDGDDTARFFRRAQPPDGQAATCEAFHWGAMTSGSVSKALWLLMAPFGVINLARYTLPLRNDADATSTGRRTRQVADVALRLLGLVLTVLLVSTVAFVSIDLFAWQCGGTPLCAEDRIPAVAEHLGSWSWRLPLGAAVPAAVVVALSVFSSRTHLHQPPRVTADTTQQEAAGHLGTWQFWAPSPRTALLRRLHLCAAVAVVAMLVCHLSTHEVAGLKPAEGWSHTLLWVLFWASLAIAAWCVVVTALGRSFLAQDANAAVDPAAVPTLYVVLRWLTWVVFLAVVVIASAWGSTAVHRKSPRNARLTGFDWAFQTQYAAAAALLLVLFLANWTLRGGHPAQEVPRPFRQMWRGWACFVLAALAVLLATGFTSGLAIQLSRVLGYPETVANKAYPLNLPELFQVTAVLWGLLLVPVTVLAGLYLMTRYLRPRPGVDLSTRIAQDYPIGEVPTRTLKAIGRSWRLGRLKYKAPLCLMCLGIAGGLAALAQGALGILAVLPGHDPVPGWLQEHVYGTGRREAVFNVFAEIGTWVLTALAAGLAFLGIRAFRSPSLRRQVGVLWDLLAFWPRLTHPIVPPPYGGRAVLALAQRLEDKAKDGGRVVLSGHSQGSVVCVAALSAVSDDVRRRVALVTHGSQLMWAYAALFPSYLGHPILRDLYENKLGLRWRNLHRWSDYIGGPVLAHPTTGRVEPVLPADATPWTTLGGDRITAADVSGGDSSWLRRIGHEYQLRDPYNIVAADGRPASPLLAHSAYYADPAYDRVVGELLTAIPPEATGA